MKFLIMYASESGKTKYEAEVMYYNLLKYEINV